MPRKIGELELDFENPTWKSNWDFEEITVRFKAGWAGRKIGQLELDFENPKAGRVGIPTGILRNLRPGGRVLKNNKKLLIINYTEKQQILLIINYTKTTKFY